MKYFITFLTLIAVMSAHSQELLSTYGNCTEYAHGFISIESESKDIAPLYCDAMSFSEGLAAVKKGDKWGFIEAKNNVVIGFQYDGARSFSDGQSIVRQGDFYGVINKQGEFVIPPRYYDLMSYELEGKQYFISRDSTFFQGIIDREGKEILPHRYTYIITLEPIITTERKLYKNIPFYTAFQKIDSSQGSFYEQFKGNAFQFSPEKGRHDIYDLQFNKLASKLATNYSDGFQHHQLQRIDTFLEKNAHKKMEEKTMAIDSLLALPELDSMSQVIDPSYVGSGRMTSNEINSYLDSLGYRVFTEDGKTGLRKGNEILIPAQHTELERVNGVIRFPQSGDIAILEEHYGGRFRNKSKGIFDVFMVIPHDGEPTQASHQYSLSGAVKLPVRIVNKQSKKVISRITPLGFLYLHTKANVAEKESRTYSLVNWRGQELVPGVYQKIEVLKTGHVLVTQEKEVGNGMEEHFGLFNRNGKEIIPAGKYSDIKPFDKSTDNLYLAVSSETYPTIEEKKETQYANKTYVIIKVDGNSTKVINTFSASMVYPWHLDPETGMLRYKRNLEDK
ncbi:MAG: WG repeat-containing protein [Sphingobacterium sp.]